MPSRSAATEAASSKSGRRPTKGPMKRKLETSAPGANPNVPFPSLISQNRNEGFAACPTRRRQRKAPSMAAALLGDDGRGYDLAKRLEACGAWRAWLGDAAYAHFSHALSSPATWEAFLSPRAGAGAGSVHPAANGRNSQIQLQLQLRARALLYDKASAALFLSHSHSINDINPNFLQLHGDDVYFLLDEEKEDGSQFQSQSAFNARHSESDNLTKWPSSWYKQYAEKFRIRHHKLPAGEKEILKRTPDGMAAYLKLAAVHKRKRQVFKDYNSPGAPISMNEENFIPELQFPSDCVPDSALPKPYPAQKIPKLEFHAALDNLPGLVSRTPAMIERFGIMPEYYKVGNKYRGNGGEAKQHLTEEQGNVMVRKSLVRVMESGGFHGITAGALDVLVEIVCRHMCKLGRSLRILTDSYRKEFSAVELLKMFLQASGLSIGALSEITKGGNRSGSHQMQQQHTHQLQSQYQNNILQQRQFHQHPQMNVMHAQTLAFQQQLQQQQQQQQQLQQLRRNTNNQINQINGPRGSVMMMDPKSHHPLADVKIENTIDAQMDNNNVQSGFGSNAHNNNNQRQQQLRLQHQQQMMMAGNNLVQANNSNNNNNNNNNNSLIQPGMQQQFRTMQSVQLSQLQAQNIYGMRTAPVKVEAFHELVSGENEHNKLTPSNK